MFLSGRPGHGSIRLFDAGRPAYGQPIVVRIVHIGCRDAARVAARGSAGQRVGAYDFRMSDETARSIEIRRPTDAEIPAFIDVVGAAFGELLTEAEIEEERQTWEADRLFVAWAGDRPIGTSGNLTFGLTTPGGAVRAAGVTLVGVVPGERRRGVLVAMMRALLDDATAHAEPVAILWASEGAIYQRFGFGLGTFVGSFELPRSRARFLRPVEPVGRVRLVTADEAMVAFPPIFDSVVPSIPGAVKRREATWRYSVVADNTHGRTEYGPKFRALLEVDGVPAGYAVYRTRAEWDDRGPKGALTVLEVIGATPAAEMELWSWLCSMDLFPTIRGRRTSVPHPLQLALAEPRALGLVVNDGIWLRLVDLPAALAARRYAPDTSLVLDVTDAFLPANSGCWRLAVDANGVGTATRVTAAGPEASGAPTTPTLEASGAPPSEASGAPDLALDIADLAACYLGAVRPSELARAGRVRELIPGALARADRCFGAERAPWCSLSF